MSGILKRHDEKVVAVKIRKEKKYGFQFNG